MGPGGHGCAGNRVFCPGRARADMAGHVLSPATLIEMECINDRSSLTCATFTIPQTYCLHNSHMNLYRRRHMNVANCRACGKSSHTMEAIAYAAHKQARTC